MRFVLAMILFTSCALQLPTRKDNIKKEKTSIENIRSCVDELLTKHGVGAKDALDVCKSIYRRD